jgi:hypothetical protein
MWPWDIDLWSLSTFFYKNGASEGFMIADMKSCSQHWKYTAYSVNTSLGTESHLCGQ